MACDSRESSKSICKEIALQRPKTGKFDYLGRPNYPAHSIAFKFFTNDYGTWLGICLSSSGGLNRTPQGTKEAARPRRQPPGAFHFVELDEPIRLGGIRCRFEGLS